MRKKSPDIEKHILEELMRGKELIEVKSVRLIITTTVTSKISLNKNIKRRSHCLASSTGQKGIILPQKIKEKDSGREVLTYCPGELIQHHSSCHRFSPYSIERNGTSLPPSIITADLSCILY